MLNEQKRKFAKLIAENVDQTQAAIEAGYSEKTAGVKASQLMGEAAVQDEVKRLKRRAAGDNKPKMVKHKGKSVCWTFLEQLAWTDGEPIEERRKAADTIVVAETKLAIAAMNLKYKDQGKKAAEQEQGERMAQETDVYAALGPPPTNSVN